MEVELRRYVWDTFSSQILHETCWGAHLELIEIDLGKMVNHSS